MTRKLLNKKLNKKGLYGKASTCILQAKNQLHNHNHFSKLHSGRILEIGVSANRMSARINKKRLVKKQVVDIMMNKLRRHFYNKLVLFFHHRIQRSR